MKKFLFTVVAAALSIGAFAAEIKLNKKVKALARKSALSYKAKNSEIVVVEDFTFEAPKTKEFVNLVKNLKVNDKKTLFILSEPNKNVYLSARNLEKANIAIVSELNTYEILNNQCLVITSNSIDAITKNLKA